MSDIGMRHGLVQRLSLNMLFDKREQILSGTEFCFTIVCCVHKNGGDVMIQPEQRQGFLVVSGHVGCSLQCNLAEEQ